MTKARGRLPVLAAALLLAACAAGPTREPGATFVVVRHAEKAAGDARDPALSAAGEARAAALARRLRDEPVAAVYATHWRRAQQTARPTAETHRLEVLAYDPALPADALAARLRREHAAGTVLVVGHSNTVPAIVGALCGCAVAPLDERDYGDLYRIRSAGNGRAGLAHERF